MRLNAINTSFLIDDRFNLNSKEKTYIIDTEIKYKTKLDLEEVNSIKSKDKAIWTDNFFTLISSFK